MVSVEAYFDCFLRHYLKLPIPKAQSHANNQLLTRQLDSAEVA
jgi:hypothetical protein